MGDSMITSPSNPKIKRLAGLNQKAKARQEEGVFLAEGIKMFREAPEELIQEIYLTEEVYHQEFAENEVLKRKGFELVSKEVFQKISDTKTPQGILTVLKRPVYKLEDLLNIKDPLFLILEDIQDPGNLGTMIRTGEGAGVHGIFLSEHTTDVYNPKTIRSTMGSIYRIPFLKVPSLKDTIHDLQNQGICIFAAHLKGGKDYDSYSYSEGTAFLIGNEGNGLKEETAELCDQYLKIPMEGNVESLNAAMAAGILMYEAHRQRKLN